MPTPSAKVVSIIPAAGMGVRMGLPLPKQYYEIDNKPILAYTLEKFQKCHAVDGIILVVSEDIIERSKEIVDQWKIQKVFRVIQGGEKRQDSVRAGLNVLSGQTEIVVIHDGVRPFVSVMKIQESIEAAKQHGAAILVVPVKDTIKRCQGLWVEETLERDTLYRVQTPQCFCVEWIRNAYAKAAEDDYYATDDAALVERLGHRIRIIDGEDINIKLTSPADLKLAERLIREEYR